MLLSDNKFAKFFGGHYHYHDNNKGLKKDKLYCNIFLETIPYNSLTPSGLKLSLNVINFFINNEIFQNIKWRSAYDLSARFLPESLNHIHNLTS